jgi:hypothetical protein
MVFHMHVWFCGLTTFATPFLYEHLHRSTTISFAMQHAPGSFTSAPTYFERISGTVCGLGNIAVPFYYSGYFNELDAFAALCFTATEASPAAKRTRFLSVSQHA